MYRLIDNAWTYAAPKNDEHKDTRDFRKKKKKIATFKKKTAVFAVNSTVRASLPLIRLLLCLLGGIGLSRQPFSLGHTPLCFALLGLVVLLVTGACMMLRGLMTGSAKRSLLFACMVLLSGVFIARSAGAWQSPFHTLVGSENRDVICGVRLPAFVHLRVVRELPSSAEQRRYEAEGEVRIPGISILHTRVVIQSESERDTLLRAGRVVWASAKLRVPRPPLLFTDWNEEAWCAEQNIEWIARLYPASIAMDHGSVRSSSGFKDQVRDKFEGLLRSCYMPNDRGLIRSIILGDISGLDEDTRNTMHRSVLSYLLHFGSLHLALILLLVRTLSRMFRAPVLRTLFVVLSALLVCWMWPDSAAAQRIATLVLLERVTLWLGLQLSVLHRVLLWILGLSLLDPVMSFSSVVLWPLVVSFGLNVLGPGVRRNVRRAASFFGVQRLMSMRTLPRALVLFVCTAPLLAAQQHSLSYTSFVAFVVGTVVLATVDVSVVGTLLVTVVYHPAALWMASFSAELLSQARSLNEFMSEVGGVSFVHPQAWLIACVLSLGLLWTLSASRRRSLLFRAMIGSSFILVLQLSFPMPEFREWTAHEATEFKVCYAKPLYLVVQLRTVVGKRPAQRDAALMECVSMFKADTLVVCCSQAVLQPLVEEIRVQSPAVVIQCGVMP